MRDWLLRSRDNRADERLFIFTLATTASEGCSLQPAAREQRYAANYADLQVADAHMPSSGGAPFSYHCRRTYE